MTAGRLGGLMAADRPADRPSDAARDASNPTTPTDTAPTTATLPLLDTPPTTATWPLLEKPALPPAATESRRERRAAPAPDAVVVAQAVGRSEAVRENVGEAAGMAFLWGMVVGGFGLTVVEAEDFSWSAAALVVAIAATITVVVFVVRSVGWPETTRVEVHPHEIVKEAVWWWRRSPTRVAIGFDEITSVDVDYEDGRKLLKVQASGRTLSGIPAGPGRAAALAIGQRLVAHGRAHTIKNDDTRIHLGLDGYGWPTY